MLRKHSKFSKQIIKIVDTILNPKLTAKIGYTFDAGPHAFLFVHKNVLDILKQKKPKMIINYGTFLT